MSNSRSRSPRFGWVIVALVLLAGVTLSVWLWESVRAGEEAQEELAFVRQMEARHALIRQTLVDYEDCLLAMRVFMTHGRDVDQENFSLVARAQLTRFPGFLGLQWAPRVRAGERENWERDNQKILGTWGRIRERTRQGQDVVAAARNEYFPITYVEPLAANAHVIGTDASLSPLRSTFVAALGSGSVMMSGKLKLVYESESSDGIVMVCPVFSSEAGAPKLMALRGFLLGVFRVVDLLVQPWNRAPEASLDAMFIDESAESPTRRVLYCHLLRDTGAPMPTEEEFCRGPHRRLTLQVAGRNWTIIYRRAIGQDPTSSRSPLIALGAGLTVTALAASLLTSLLRRNVTIERQVRERTEELSESRRQLGALMHALPGMAFRGVYDDVMNLTFVSEGVSRLTGYEPADFLEGRVHWREIVHPEDLGRVREQTVEAIRNGLEIELEYRIRARDGSEKWILSRGRAVTEAGRTPVFEGLAIDITAQKEAEAERLNLERKLLEGQKLESLGLLAGGVAHDFNNLLSTMLGNAELVQLALPPGHPSGGKLRAIESAASHAAELCRQMLAYAGKGRLVIESTNLSQLVDGMLPLLRVTSAQTAKLRLELVRELPSVSVDATQIRQIVMNLVLNAVDAMAGRTGEIVVRTGLVRATQEMLSRCVAGSELRAGEYVFLEVSDQGAGMSADVCARIFDPFFTTKFAGRGLGLAAVLGIVRSHGGALCVSSRPGAGSSFRLLLPATGQTPANRPAPPAEVSGEWRGTGAVLVVDDEPHVREVMVEMLRGFGLAPTPLPGGREAVAALRENPQGYALVVLDLLMPDMSGEATLAVVREINPHQRVLLMSGYSEEGLVSRLTAGRGVRFLPKPFTRASLERELRSLLT